MSFGSRSLICAKTLSCLTSAASLILKIPLLVDDNSISSLFWQIIHFFKSTHIDVLSCLNGKVASVEFLKTQHAT